MTTLVDTTAQPIAPWWWPTPGSEEDLQWQRQTITVIRKAAATGRATHYSRSGAELLADDLESWMLVKTVEFRDKFDSGRFLINRPILGQWAAALYRSLTRISKWMADETLNYGMRHDDTMLAYYRGTSGDRSVDDDRKTTVAELGTWPWQSGEPTNPEDNYIARENLCDVAVQISGIHHDPAITRRVWSDYTGVLGALDELAGEQTRDDQCARWGCGYPPVVNGGYCKRHADTTSKRTCTTQGCDRTQLARKLCATHYRRWKKANADPCTIDGCDNPQSQRGLCDTHYDQARKSGELERVQPSTPAYTKPCTVEGCTRAQAARGLCKACWTRQKRAKAGQS